MTAQTVPHRATVAALLLLLAGSPGTGAEWQPWSEGRLRAERTTNLPDGRTIERLRLHAFAGVSWYEDNVGLELAGALKLSAGTDDERENRANLDNESSDDFEIGELYLRWRRGDGLLEAGRSYLPFDLSAMVWDADLRPVGLSWRWDRSIVAYDRLSVTAGYLAPSTLDDFRSRLAGAQAAYHWREGAPTAASARLAYLAYHELDAFLPEQLVRTNRLAGGELASDFRIVDLFLDVRLAAAGRPLDLSLDVAHNLEAEEDGSAARFGAVWGRAEGVGAWELGGAWQRVERDAVLAAFNEDDWWFPTRMRGFRLWAGVGLGPATALEVAYFRERRDDLDDHVERLFVDWTWFWR